MLNFIKKRKLKREARIYNLTIRHEMEVEEATIKMTSRPCAIRQFYSCDRDCVHFEAGSVESLGWHWTRDEPAFWVEQPKCKLWR